MAGDYDGDELPSVDHSPLNEGPWEKQAGLSHTNLFAILSRISHSCSCTCMKDDLSYLDIKWSGHNSGGKMFGKLNLQNKSLKMILSYCGRHIIRLALC